MKSVFVLVLVAFAAFAIAGDDLDLDESNFQQTIDDNEFVLVMFFAPWCGHCKSFKPHFAEAATKSKGKYVLAKVDCTLDTAKQLCQDQEVRGYPTVKFFKNAIPMDYTGPRDTEGVLNWMDKKTGPAAHTLKSESDVKDFLEKHKGEAVVIGYFDTEGSDSQKEFLKAAGGADTEDIKFGQAIGISGKTDNSISMHVAHSAEPIKFEGDNLEQWAFEESFPLVDEVGGHNFAKYAKLGKPLHLVFVKPSDENKEQLLKDLTVVAGENRDDSFSWIDAEKYNAQIKGMGASGNVVPCIIRLSSFGSDNKPVVFEEELSLDNLRDWAAGVKSGKYKYTPKSEPIPESNDGPVKTVVGKNWEDIVLDGDKNVLVEFYAPWCGHCKQLAPKYEQLGEKFVDSDSVVIAKVDGTANDVEAHYEIKGFPTLLLYTKTNKDSPKVYEGAREVDDLETWINENSD